MPPMPQGSGEATKQRRSSFGSVVASTTPSELIGPSENRVALVLTPSSIGELQYAPQPIAVGHTSINLGTTAGPLILRYEDVGDIIKKAWYVAFTSGGPSTVGFIETLEG